MQSYFLAVNMAEGEGKTDFYLLMLGNSSFSIGENCVTNVPDFFFCGNIALCKWLSGNTIMLGVEDLHIHEFTVNLPFVLFRFMC